MAKKNNMNKPSFNQRISGMTDTNMLLSITIVVFLLMYIGAVVFMGGAFEKPQTFFNILNSNAPLIITACGMSIVMITGGIDISVGGVVGLVTMVCAVNLDFQGGNVWIALLLSLGIGLAFGLVQGALVAYLGIQPFIVTLAGMFFARGLTTIIHTNPFNIQNKAFIALKDTRIPVPGMGYYNLNGIYIDAYVEIGVVIALVIVAVLFAALRWTKKGRNFYAVGGNRQSALMLGINVKRTVFASHVLCGLLAGLAGFVFVLHSANGAVTNAQGMEMNAIAAAIVGGTMLTGGVGNMIGTFFGVLSLALIQSIVALVGLDDPWWTGITIAAMLCIFLVIQSVVMAWKRKK